MGNWRNTVAWAGLAIGGLVGSSVASAAIPDSDGTIHGCVNDATGVVRIVDSAKSGSLGSCIRTGSRLLQETPVNWNQAGVAGPAGPPGPQGEPGFATITRRSTSHPALEIPAGGRVVDAFVFCEAGERVVGGFYFGLPPNTYVASEGPEIGVTAQGWSFSLSSTTGATVVADFIASVTCVS